MGNVLSLFPSQTTILQVITTWTAKCSVVNLLPSQTTISATGHNNMEKCSALNPRGMVQRTKKLKTHQLRTQSLKVLPLMSGVGQHIAMHASPTAADFFLELIFTLPVHSPAFFPQTSPEFFLY